MTFVTKVLSQYITATTPSNEEVEEMREMLVEDWKKTFPKMGWDEKQELHQLEEYDDAKAIAEKFKERFPQGKNGKSVNDL